MKNQFIEIFLTLLFGIVFITSNLLLNILYFFLGFISFWSYCYILYKFWIILNLNFEYFLSIKWFIILFIILTFYYIYKPIFFYIIFYILSKINYFLSIIPFLLKSFRFWKNINSRLRNYINANLYIEEPTIAEWWLEFIKTNFLWNLLKRLITPFWAMCPNCGHHMISNHGWYSWKMSCPDCKFFSKNSLFIDNSKVFNFLKKWVSWLNHLNLAVIWLEWKEKIWFINHAKNSYPHVSINFLDIDYNVLKDLVEKLLVNQYDMFFIFLDYKNLDILNQINNYLKENTNFVSIVDLLSHKDISSIIILPKNEADNENKQLTSSINTFFKWIGIELSYVHQKISKKIYQNSLKWNYWIFGCFSSDYSSYKIEDTFFWIRNNQNDTPFFKTWNICSHKMVRHQNWFTFILPYFDFSFKNNIITSFIENRSSVFLWYKLQSNYEVINFFETIAEKYITKVSDVKINILVLKVIILINSSKMSFFYVGDYLTNVVYKIIKIIFYKNNVVDMDLEIENDWNKKWVILERQHDIEVSWLFAIEVKSALWESFASITKSINNLSSRALVRWLKWVLIISNDISNPDILNRKPIPKAILDLCKSKEICVIKYSSLWHILLQACYKIKTDEDIKNKILSTAWEYDITI